MDVNLADKGDAVVAPARPSRPHLQEATDGSIVADDDTVLKPGVLALSGGAEQGCLRLVCNNVYDFVAAVVGPRGLLGHKADSAGGRLARILCVPESCLFSGAKPLLEIASSKIHLEGF